ncbi:hypothetical protein JCM3774_001728 [Rhodotorula dairenensis]
MPERYLRTACVQLSPRFKDWDASRARADALIAGLQPGELDLLVLPEMALTGYCFQSRDDAHQFAEEGDSGPTFRWAAATARRIGCYVLIGLPTVESRTGSNSSEDRRIYHNSVLVVSPAGTLVDTYHKTFLYGELTNDRADYLWADAGAGFMVLELPFPPSSPFHTAAASSPGESGDASTFRLVPAICMDLNMPTFDAPFDRFELATFASEHNADIVVGSMAWLDSEPPLDAVEDEDETRGDEDNSTADQGAEDPATRWDAVRSVISYWVLRLSPLIGSGAAFVCANRVGREGDVVFTGSSCALELSDRPCVVQHASKRGEEVVIARVSLSDRRM